MRSRLVAGNWKMNGSAVANEELVREILAQPHLVDCVLCPPAVYLQQVASMLQGSSILLGAQNLDWHESGAFTGEISGPMLRDVGASVVLVGHSERRALFGEDSEVCLKKTESALGAGLTPIFCVGETRDEREAGKTLEVIARQLRDVIELAALEQLIIAYEPVWAIGTGEVATPEQAGSVHQQIRGLVAEKDEAVAAGIRILYGGSVNAENAAGLFEQEDIDGALVGGASLKAKDFSAICRAASD